MKKFMNIITSKEVGWMFWLWAACLLILLFVELNSY